MTIQDFLAVLAMDLVRHSPILLVGIFGLWYCATRQELLADAHRCAWWGFAILVTHSVLSVIRDVGFIVWQVNALEAGQSRAIIGITRTLLGIPAYAALLAALILLTRAVFVGRNGTTSSNRGHGSARQVNVA